MSTIKIICPHCKNEFKCDLGQESIRTLKQNALYWPVYVNLCADALGYFPDEMHEEFKRMFNAKDSKISPGEKFGGSTTRMTTAEFTKYLERIRIWAGTQEINLPEGSDNDPK